MARIGKLKLRDNRWYGCRPDTADQRDLMFALEYPRLVEAAPPPNVDLRSTGFFTPCYDQGQLGSCVGNGAGAAFDYDQRKQGEAGYVPSRLFIYYNGRAIEGTVRSDSGIEIRDGVKAIAKLGAPPETLWAYKIAKFASKPTPKAYAAGKKRLALKYARVSNIGDAGHIMAAIAGGFPVIIGISVYASFESDAVAKTGVVPMPEPKEEMLGGHCMLAVGYTTDSTGKVMFIVRNSWGTSWGDGGHCYIPATYLIDSDLASDFWIVDAVA